MQQWPIEQGIYDCADIALQSGYTLPQAKIVWRSHGTLNADKSNVIVYPTSYSAQHSDIEWLIGPDKILDPRDWFIIIPNMFCNGLSSSPSNHTTAPYHHERFPLISTYDNVMQQQRLLRDVFAVEQVALVYGWSMGAQQAYHWGALFGDAVERIVVCCGSARTAAYNQVFLESIRAALCADPAYINGWFTTQPVAGLRAMGRVYAGWGLSDTFYRDEVWRTLNYASLNDFLVGSWEGAFLRRDANDLLWQMHTWQNSDISANRHFNHDLMAALGAIEARVLIMPSETDRYFTVADHRREMPYLQRAELKIIPSIWGHRAGNPYLNAEDAQFIKRAVTELLAQK